MQLYKRQLDTFLLIHAILLIKDKKRIIHYLIVYYVCRKNMVFLIPNFHFFVKSKTNSAKIRLFHEILTKIQYFRQINAKTNSPLFSRNFSFVTGWYWNWVLIFSLGQNQYLISISPSILIVQLIIRRFDEFFRISDTLEHHISSLFNDLTIFF